MFSSCSIMLSSPIAFLLPGRAGLELHVDNVDVEMIVCWLVVHIQLQLVGVDGRVDGPAALEELGPHVPQPRDVFSPQVSQAPDVAPLDDAEQVDALQRLAVPVRSGSSRKPSSPASPRRVR